MAAAHAQLEDVVTDAMQRHRIPGVAIGVLVDGSEHSAGFGVTSVEHPLAVDSDTLLQIGSITKTFTATAIMRLVEAGALALDQPVSAYLPDLRLSAPDVATRLTLRHLLTHTSGFEGDDFSDTGTGDDALARYVAGMAELPQITPLGEMWSYCNSGFCLAGRVVEVVTGQPFEQALTELVLRPLGMERSFFFPADVMTHRFAVGHWIRDEGLAVARPWPIPRASNPAGGISTSVNDLLRYARFHLGDGRGPDGARVLAADTLALMHAPQVTVGGATEATGIAWMLRSIGGVRVIEHAGGTNGQTSTLQLVPERGFALAILTNADRGPELYRTVSRWAMAHYLGLEPNDPQPVDLPEAELAAYIGRYDARMSAVELTLRDGGLIAQFLPKGGFPTKDTPPWPAPPATRVAFFGADRIVALDTPFTHSQAEFIRDPDGQIQFLRWGGRLAARQP